MVSSLPGLQITSLRYPVRETNRLLYGTGLPLVRYFGESGMMQRNRAVALDLTPGIQTSTSSVNLPVAELQF